ncbi:threonine/homoserine/homoserine lactone efflux protein [Desulfohalotomaculum tongense]|uniref:LysE family translocator n=1 Tax=Desulforadius tongensis TaxID=1216062 RepID=UPI00195AAA2D|nr:LysE family transporter [Desulforadius tongensis]MBM7855089.1 threonine/homoserine/homoserine lactone efflux protein [Desulforadius tongensis]
MTFDFFIKAAIAGLLLSVPIGPVNLLCIRRTLVKGRIIGLVTGLGASSADSFFAFISAFGLSFIVNFFEREEAVLTIGGGILLCLLGIRTFFAVPKDQSSKYVSRGLFSAYVSSLLLTLANPVTIIAFTAIFASFGVDNESRTFSFSFMVALGVFTGATLWWVALSSVVSLFRNKFNNNGIIWMNRISGVLITIFGIITLLRLI